MTVTDTHKWFLSQTAEHNLSLRHSEKQLCILSDAGKPASTVYRSEYTTYLEVTP